MLDLVDKNGKIIYSNIIKQYTWIVEKDQKCVLSPDCDGLLCGLLMSSVFNWKIVGFYDGKIMSLFRDEKIDDCIFLDMEIFRKYIKSLGQHMLLWNKKNIPESWSNFEHCISPNNIRNYDGKNNFAKKYPLGTIHLLLAIIGEYKKIEIKKEAICPLLFVDGTFKNLFNYPENCLSWLDFLCAENENSPLKKVFFNEHYTTSSLMLALRDFFEKLKKINDNKKGGDKITISDRNGNPINFEEKNWGFCLSEKQKLTAMKFLALLSDLTGWKFNESMWRFDNFTIYKFTKNEIKPNNKNFNELIAKNPLSWAMTAANRIEYTTETPDRMPR